MPPIVYKDFTIETFNFTGLVKKTQRLTSGDYSINVCSLQKTKIKGLDVDIGVKQQNLIALDTDSKYYGHAFVINTK